MARHVRIILVLLALALTACSEEAPAPPTAGEPKEFAAVCDKANDGQRVTTTGYLRFPDSFTGDMSVVLRLYETDAFEGTPIGVQTRFGTLANQVEMVQDQYTDADLEVHLADGSTVTYGTKVEVSGKVYYPVVSQDFTCGLENPLVEPAE
jgi:hypothetical protein